MYRISYEFCFESGDSKHFHADLDADTLIIAAPDPTNAPGWTRLDFKPCPCCPLQKEKHPHCPIALNIASVVDSFKNTLSYETCAVRCVTPERIYLKNTSLMEGLSSLLGLIMAASSCPIMALFRPMARFHLPFSSVEETTVRAVSLYLLRQYFIHKSKRVVDLDLKKLQNHYETIQNLNTGLLERIRGLHQSDADRNAICIFHSLSQLLSTEIDTDLCSLNYLFPA
ncbi:MAG: hypothetical protein P1P89_01030 [Desulfobacterales bacterium]|nr:hypothetical protein [Desulfobacterales bacterium]